MSYDLDRWTDFDNTAIKYIEDRCDDVVIEAVNHSAYQNQMPLGDVDQSYSINDLRPVHIKAQLKLCDKDQLVKLNDTITSILLKKLS